MIEEQTIHGVISGLHGDLRAYLEAQYHVRDESVLHERRLLLNDGATIAQTPYLEATPAYSLADEYSKIGLPRLAQELLCQLATIGKSGIYKRPYEHQAIAVREFLKGRDVLAATGTGSGKTEIFLLAILGRLAEECSLGKRVTEAFGCRTLILYPMNALVSDQLARLRRVFGNKEVADNLREKRGRRVRFGMYTSRTPFPGDIESDLNKARCKDLLKTLYRPILENPTLLNELKTRGKWPAKDVARFFGEEGGRWSNRLKTADDDVELLMRHEIQAACPDILITNYSMLEYMMLRPIERSIFDQTAGWLKNKGTIFTIVLDEAHMYRGATGAEVAFLLRRLLSRLGVSRDRVRFVLTTASVGKSERDEQAARDFVCDLTGLPKSGRSSIAFVRGVPEKWPGARPASLAETRVLSEFDGREFSSCIHDPKATVQHLNRLGQKLGWNAMSEEATRSELYSLLGGFGPATLLVTDVSGNASVLDAVADKIFPEAADNSMRDKALDSLLRISNYARDEKTDKVFLPARLHLFFRGLSGLYACVNAKCRAKRDSLKTTLLGKLYSEPRVSCDCGSRVFEILTHRDCGALYLRGYVPQGDRPSFLWHEPTTGIGDESSGAELSLHEMQLLVSQEPPSNPSLDGWLHIASGQLVWDHPASLDGWLKIYAPDNSTVMGATASHVFDDCPQCGLRTRFGQNEPSRIMDLKTKGEQPFGQLVKRQLFSQFANGSMNIDTFPNQGRKVLLFSDGRQKAARLAKAIPDDVEADAFRELLALGLSRVEPARRERLQLQKVYATFIAACSEAKLCPYSGDDSRQVRSDIQAFRNSYFGNLSEYIDDCPAKPPISYLKQLYRQAYGGLYSMRFICAGWLAPLPPRLMELGNLFPAVPPAELAEIALTWIQWLASDVAIDADFPRWAKAEVAGFPRAAWAHKGKFSRVIGDLLRRKGINVKEMEEALQKIFATFVAAEGGHYLKADATVLKIDLARKWYRCKACYADSPFKLVDSCPWCGRDELLEFDPNTDLYVQSRKGYWRDPVLAAHNHTSIPRLLSAEEHTAQLNRADSASGWIKTEEYELRFQDVLIDPINKPPVDVLSCTTTMEVGIDIGSLVAVGLRNVPPQRENYQQRAGRAGRRGSAISTVVTYCQGGAHDNHYYANVEEIVSGSPRKLTVKVNNAKIARRHVRSYLLQQFFSGLRGVASPDVLSSLGTLKGFFEDSGEGSLEDFLSWIKRRVSDGVGDTIRLWIGDDLEGVGDVSKWASKEAEDFASQLQRLRPKVQEMIDREAALNVFEQTKLLEFLLDEAILPTYAFPTDLASFRVEEWDVSLGNLVSRYEPTQAITRALTEYAPGRLITIDKKTFKCTAVTAKVSPTEAERARPLFENPHRRPYVFCDQKQCCYVEDVAAQDARAREGVDCPLCRIGKLRVVEMITPEVFLPEDGQEVSALDDEADFSYATPAQFPVPLYNEGDKQTLVSRLSDSLEVLRQANARLVVVNKGDREDQSGFCVCNACGLATLASLGPGNPSHSTPYKILAQNRSQASLRRCKGSIQSPVFLGHRFVTDLVILRVQIFPPLCQAPRALSAEYCALQDALQTLADALPLAAGRMFDVDYTEFSAGYRLISQSGTGASIAAEIYMFDTLSGGAGYSERVGDAMDELLRTYVPEVLACDDKTGEGCDRSCYRCLRHYYNQFYHTKLDRRLASDLLQFVLCGKRPEDQDVEKQKAELLGLRAMLELDGIETSMSEFVDGVEVPMVATFQGQSVAVCVTHSLVAEQYRTGMVDLLDGVSIPVRPLNRYQLTRNLPSCHLAVRKCLKFRRS